MHNIDAAITNDLITHPKSGTSGMMEWLRKKMFNEEYEEVFEKLESILGTNQNEPEGAESSGLKIADMVILAAEARYLSGGFQACLEMIDKYTESGLLEAEDGAANLIRGWVLTQYGRHNEAMDIAKGGLKRTTLTSKPLLHGQYLHLRGMCRHKLGDNENALDDLRGTGASAALSALEKRSRT